MAQTTYQITLSTGGKVAVSVTTDEPREMSSGMAWAREAYKQFMSSQEQNDQGGGPEEVPICAVHHVPMAKQLGKYGPFWSCHERNEDGSFCTYKPEGR